MTNIGGKENFTIQDEDIFEDSSFLGNFQECTFQGETTHGPNTSRDSVNKSTMNVSALCCDEEISGYDKLTGKTWIYPTNYPVRDYQFNIIKSALINNTLVSLPTGLGKTFIAAVIMYNFYRWYPLGKIVFTAPTRPLVAQQIDACYNIIAIPPDDTIEMTGHMQANTRKLHWKTKRVFFATPQVICNDIKSGICPSDRIRCLVFDEAHRARGNYAYCSIIGTLTDMGHKTFRVLALSATPGSKVDDVINVVKNLHIAHLELRSEFCIDVSPYSHTKQINTIVIQLGPHLTQLRQQYVEILDGYARRLKQLNILPHNVGNLSKGRVVMLYKEYQNKERGARHPQHNYIMKDFTLLIALYHGLELLVKHGSRVFLNFFDEHPEKSWIQADDRLTALLERLRDDLGINPLSLDRSVLPDGTIPELPKDLTFGHPKFDKLREIMLDHFKGAKEKGQDTRAIVFCEYRESVHLVHCLLLQCRPLIAPLVFVGQGATGKDNRAVSQKQQLRAMSSFRGGASNALVATCVAEEGLDVGAVDLILCFDVASRSPVRLVQRCGRTGRERGGKVYILVTEGKEHQTLMDCMRQRDGLNKKIQQSREVHNSLYKLNPRMMPHDFTPICQKMYITVAKKVDPKEKAKVTKKGQTDLRNMFAGKSSSSGSNSSLKEIEPLIDLTREEFQEMFPEGFREMNYFDEPREYFAMNADTFKKTTEGMKESGGATAWLEWQRAPQRTASLGHARDALILSELLQYCDRHRFQQPPNSQNPAFNTQDINTQIIRAASPIKPKVTNKKKPKVAPIKPITNKDGDIRALFSTATKSTKSYTKLINDLGVQNVDALPTSLIDLYVDLTLENTSATYKCYLCANGCDCSIFKALRESKLKEPVALDFLKELKLPDIELLDEINPEAIAQCVAKGNDSVEIVDDNMETNVEHRNLSTNFDLEFDFESPDIIETAIKVNSEQSDKNFEIGDIEDIFDESSPEEAVQKTQVKEIENEQNSSNPKAALEFFGLDSIDDIFADSDNSNHPDDGEHSHKDEDNIPSFLEANLNPSMYHKPITLECPRSPSILSGTIKPTAPAPTSPILCSQRKFQLSTTKPHSSTPNNLSRRKQLFPDSITNPENGSDRNLDVAIKSKLLDDVTKNSTANHSNNKSMFTITQLVEMINKTGGNDSRIPPSNATIEEMKILEEIQKADDERSMSPILLTQADKKSVPKKANTSLNTKRNESLIILESDSDSDLEQTIVYDIDNEPNKITQNETLDTFTSPLTVKRKFEEENSGSPYFNKRFKLDKHKTKTLSLQKKIIAALNKSQPHGDEKEKKINFMCHSPTTTSQKENVKPQIQQNGFSQIPTKDKLNDSPLAKFQMFKRDPKSFKSRTANNNAFKKPEIKPSFGDSDDDFDVDGKKSAGQKILAPNQKNLVNHKIRKKLNAKNSLLETEADVSGDSGSGDELSDGSVGSIIDFICDEQVHDTDDMYAHYAKSVKSPVKGAFKIPQLPSKYNKAEIFSQYIEEDAYEMDSFCVDSNVGLTQVHDDSLEQLELAEEKLERRRKGRRKGSKADRSESPPDLIVISPSCDNGDSPVVKRGSKHAKRRISSDSDSG